MLDRRIRYATQEGKKYFIEHPSKLVDLIKEDFKLAQEYFHPERGFSQEEINDFYKMIALKHKRIHATRLEYSIFKEMIQVLTDIPNKYYHVVPFDLPPATSGIIDPEDMYVIKGLIRDLWPHISSQYAKNYGDDYYAYYYRYKNLKRNLFSFKREICFETIYAIQTISPPSFKNILEVHAEWESANYVKAHLSKMIAHFIDSLHPNNLLDFEFSTRTQDTFVILAKQGHYDLLSTLLKHVSNTLAFSELKNRQISANQNLLQKMMADLPRSSPALPSQECITAILGENNLSTDVLPPPSQLLTIRWETQQTRSQLSAAEAEQNLDDSLKTIYQSVKATIMGDAFIADVNKEAKESSYMILKTGTKDAFRTFSDVIDLLKHQPCIKERIPKGYDLNFMEQRDIETDTWKSIIYLAWGDRPDSNDEIADINACTIF